MGFKGIIGGTIPPSIGIRSAFDPPFDPPFDRLRSPLRSTFLRSPLRAKTKTPESDPSFCPRDAGSEHVASPHRVAMARPSDRRRGVRAHPSTGTDFRVASLNCGRAYFKNYAQNY